MVMRSKKITCRNPPKGYHRVCYVESQANHARAKKIAAKVRQLGGRTKTRQCRIKRKRRDSKFICIYAKGKGSYTYPFSKYR